MKKSLIELILNAFIFLLGGVLAYLMLIAFLSLLPS